MVYYSCQNKESKKYRKLFAIFVMFYFDNKIFFKVGDFERETQKHNFLTPKKEFIMEKTKNQNTTTATAKGDTKKVEKVAKVNFKNSAVLDEIIDKSIYKLDAVKTFVANVGEYPNTDSLQKFVEICNNLIFNQAINEKINLWTSAKNTFITNIQDKSLNYFKNILHNAYLVSRNDALAIEKETHTEVVCDKRFLLKNSVAKYFKHAMLAILTDNGKKLIRFNSIKGEFSLVEDEPVEEIEG